MTLPSGTLQAAFFGFSEKDIIENLVLYNNFLLIFKLYVYRSSEKGLLNIISLVNQIMKTKKKEKNPHFILKKGSVLSIIKSGAKQI